MVTLWMITAYLNKRGRNRWVGLLPALVMTYVCMSYVFISPLMCGMRDRAAAYLLGGALGCDVYVANLFASLFAAAYAEVMARVRKCPAMPYLVIAILPLLPGAGVYYTMSLGLEGNRMDAVAKGLETVGIAGSLAVGILLVSTVFRLIYRHVQGARAEKS